MNLKRRQELFLDGIETSLFMIEICYSRLHHNIEHQCILGKQAKISSDSQNQILLDAWSFIDSINRLRILVSQTPGIKKSPSVVLFQNATDGIETLRDFVQHINSEIPKIEDSGWPIWGSISWIFASPEMLAQNQVSSSVIIPGRLAKLKGIPIVNPAGKDFNPPVDHITLTASSKTIDLSKVFSTNMQFRLRLDDAITRAKENQRESNEKNEILQIFLDGFPIA